MGSELTVKQESRELVTEESLKSFLFANNTNLTEREQSSFFQIAKAFNLNPFKREIYCIAYGEGEKRSLSIITGYEVYIKRAERTGQLDGWKAEFFGRFEKKMVNKEFNGRNGPYVKQVEQVVELERCFARITIHRKDRAIPFEHEVELSEYNQNNSMWNSKPVTMLKKVAIGQGFRLCFSDELCGMPYLAEEIGEQEPRTPHYSIHDENTRVKTIPQDAVDALKNAQAGSDKGEATEEHREQFVNYLQTAFAAIGDAVREVVDGHGYNSIDEVHPKDFRPIMRAVKELMPKK